MSLLGLILFCISSHAQTFTNLAGEYSIVGSLPGAQVGNAVAFNSSNGWIVWSDNATDGDGLGISARHLDLNLSGDQNVFRVNETGAGDQENPQVALLKNNGAAFVWQGGRLGFQKIFARFIGADGTFVSGDVQVNSYLGSQQIQPAIACLSNSNVVVCWTSWGQDGNLFGIYAQLLSATGQKIGAEFPVNQTTAGNQRGPSVASLANGNFVVAWSSEKLNPDVNARMQYLINIYGRIFTPSGAPVGGEFLISSATSFCSNPSLCPTSDGGFAAAWSQRDNLIISNGWDVFYRGFNASAIPRNTPFLINTQLFGDQFGPKIAADNTNAFVIWTSVGQDGSNEGIYGQYLTLNGQLIGSELRVNTTTLDKQIEPALGVDQSGRYLVAWSSFEDDTSSLDLFAQRYRVGAGNGLLAPTPYVSALSSTALSVTWSDVGGYPVAFYELYMDGSTNPIVVNGILTTITNLLPSSTHTFRLLFQLTDGRRSLLSSVASGTTLGGDNNGDGLPDDWQALYWGNNPANWPSPSADSDGDGASNLMEFLAGTDPRNPASVLRVRLTKTPQGFLLSWNTRPGFVYQVQSAINNPRLWQNLGLPRTARSSVDTINLGQNSFNAFYFYRINLLR
ncbi:MAG: fibronectin type III domain-containing protein [Limisphaerales bacterium]